MLIGGTSRERRPSATIIGGPPWCRPGACGLLGRGPRDCAMRTAPPSSAETPWPELRPGGRAPARGSCPRARRARATPRTPGPPAAFLDAPRGTPGWPATSTAGSRCGTSPPPEQRDAEEEALRDAFAADETVLSFVRRPAPPVRGDAGSMPTCRSSPRPSRGPRVVYWRLAVGAARGRAGSSWTGRRRARWTASSTCRSAREAWRVRGVSLRLEDFELRMEDGTLFSTPESARPDGLRLRGAGAGPLLAAPRRPSASSCASSRASPPSTGRSAWAFVRLHPADFDRRARDGAARARAEPGRAARPRRSACGASGPSAASSIDAPLPRSPVVAHARAWATRSWTSRGGAGGC